MTPVKSFEPSESPGNCSEDGAHRLLDAGHFNYTIGNLLGDYKIVGHLGDGTFGRTLKC